MLIKRPEAKVKPYRDKRGPDIIEVLPITSDKKLLIIEINLPNGETKYRILEEYIRANANVFEETELILDIAGIASNKIKLVKKDQPYNKFKYPQDVAVYVLIANDASVVKRPNLKFNVPYLIKSISSKDLKELLDKRKIENTSLINFNSKIIETNLR